MKSIGTHQVLLEKGDTPESIAQAIFGRTDPAAQLRKVNQAILDAHGKADFEEGDVLAIPPTWQPRAHEVLEPFEKSPGR